MKPTELDATPSRVETTQSPSLRDLFVELDPPAGGLALLRRRLAGPRHPRRRWLLVAAAPALAAVLVWFWLRPIPQLSLPTPRAPLPNHPAMVGFGLEPAPTEPVSVPASASNQVAIQRVALADDEVVFYMIATTAEPAPEP